MGLQGCWVTIIHDVGEVVVVEEVEAVVVEEIRGRLAVGKIKGGWFFIDFGPKCFHAQGIESTSIYRRWKRDILFLMVLNLDPWFSPEGSPIINSKWVSQIVKFGSWRLPKLASLGGVNRPKRIILGCSQMSGYHFRVSLSNLVERWSIKCYWNVAPWVVFSVKNKEEDEQ